MQVAEFPFTSVTVSVTVLAPTLLQSKVFGLTAKDAIPQLSVEPPSTSAAVILALPEASSCTVIFWHTAVGASVSFTVTLKLQVYVVPALSVASKTLVVVPTGKMLPLGNPAVWCKALPGSSRI